MIWEDLPGLSTYTRAFTRGQRLLGRLQNLATPAWRCAEVIVDSMPLLVCRPKRGKRCAFPGAT